MLLKELGSIKMEQKEKVKHFNHILNKFIAWNKPHDSIKIDYYTSALPTNIVQFVKRVVKPTLLENFQEAIDVDKELCAIGVIVHDEPAKESKDKGRRSQNDMSKVKEKETSEIENLTRLVKSLTTEVSEPKQRMTETTVSSMPPRFA